MKVKIIIEKSSDGYTGYPLGFSKGAIVGQGSTYAEAFRSTEDSITAFIDYYGIERFRESFGDNLDLQEAFIAESGVLA
ncbi:MAG: type II toxin-antitoxin system HicB family antitoxin [Ignavibacteriae bacterium]|nr:type II toxin-antitoxin system HicB family antitoxin [Ignavibacteriota bacterium]